MDILNFAEFISCKAMLFDIALVASGLVFFYSAFYMFAVVHDKQSLTVILFEGHIPKKVITDFVILMTEYLLEFIADVRRSAMHIAVFFKFFVGISQ